MEIEREVSEEIEIRIAYCAILNDFLYKLEVAHIMGEGPDENTFGFECL